MEKIFFSRTYRLHACRRIRTSLAFDEPKKYVWLFSIVNLIMLQWLGCFFKILLHGIEKHISKSTWNCLQLWSVISGASLVKQRVFCAWKILNKFMCINILIISINSEFIFWTICVMNLVWGFLNLVQHTMNKVYAV